MKMRHGLPAALAAAVMGVVCSAQSLDHLNAQWRQIIAAVRQGDDLGARAALVEFTMSATSYVRSYGRNWQIEYLVGSADCMFADKRKTGAEFLQDILANNRSLNEAGHAELKRQLAACTDTAHASTAINTAAPPDVVEVSTHYQSVGVSGSMKGGGETRWNQESSAMASPIPAAELAARLVRADEPQRALQNALTRASTTARGATEEGFAVVNVSGSSEEARLTGDCLKEYARPLKAEFQIQSSQYMITAYSVPSGESVYEYAQKLHGLNLPIGVLAYSVPDDMSLVSTDNGAQCGSMAHELVHLLIRQNFPGAPAWLEEGLASEVAIASPTPQRLRFGWSWRDDMLQRRADVAPSVADLLNMPWSGLNAYERSEARQAEANQAMAAVFIRYLDAKGKLGDIYFSVRDQHFSPDLSGFKSYRETVEEKMGMRIDRIDADFRNWFKEQAVAHPYNPPVIVPPMQGPSQYNAPNAAAPHDNCVPVSGNEPPRSCTPTKSATPNAPAEPMQAPNAATPQN